MKVVIAFESVYGNTRQIAEAIGSGFADRDEVTVEPICDAPPVSLRADLLIVGGPTHVHRLATPTTWRAAVEATGQDPTLVLDPTACGVHLRDWLDTLPNAPARAAAFDTRLDAQILLTGHASAAISRRLKRRGYRLIADPESFLVDHESTLIDGELKRARRWGEALSTVLHSADPDMATVAAPTMVAVAAGN